MRALRHLQHHNDYGTTSEIGTALEYVRNTIFTPENGDRSDAKNVILILQNGNFHNHEDEAYVNSTKMLLDDGFQVILVEMNTIDTHDINHNCNHFFDLHDQEECFRNISELGQQGRVQKVKNDICVWNNTLRASSQANRINTSTFPSSENVTSSYLSTSNFQSLTTLSMPTPAPFFPVCIQCSHLECLINPPIVPCKSDQRFCTITINDSIGNNREINRGCASQDECDQINNSPECQKANTEILPFGTVCQFCCIGYICNVAPYVFPQAGTLYQPPK